MMDPDYLVRVTGNCLLAHLNPKCPNDRTYAMDLLLALLQKCSSTAFSTKNSFPNTLLHRQKCRLLQSCLILWKLLVGEGSADTSCRPPEDMAIVRGMLWSNITLENMPSTRSYFEWMLAFGYIHNLFDTEDLLIKLRNYHGSAAMSISILTISYLVGCRLSTFKLKFFDLALPYFIHNNHAVRMFIIYIWDKLASADSSNAGYANLKTFIANSEHCHKFMDKLKEEHMLRDFDIDKDMNIQFIFSELPRRLGMAVDEFVAYPSFYSVDSEPGIIDLTGREYTSHIPALIERPEVVQPSSVSTVTRFQQKMVPVELAEAEEELQGVKRAEALKEKVRSGRIVVLGSFVDKVPNLAGLSRTCEVLGAATLCVPSLSTVASADFQAVCMTADRWLDIQQVRPDQVLAYLEQMRSQGFRIVAIEQSSQSVQLSSYRFHRDSVIVLGNEREGVPADVLHLVDDCIEIPQFGMVRSLNVHVTGSIVLWEARKQLSKLK